LEDLGEISGKTIKNVQFDFFGGETGGIFQRFSALRPVKAWCYTLGKEAPENQKIN